MTQKKNGFTFLELLIAVTLFTIIATVIYSNFHVGIKLWRRGDELIEKYSEIKGFFETLSRDLENTVVFTNPRDPKNISVSHWEEDKIIFNTLAQAGTAKTHYKKIEKMAYFFDSDKNEVKKASVLEKKGFDDKLESERTLLENVKNLQFEFAQPSEEDNTVISWENKWENETKTPLGVKIILTMNTKENEDKKVFEKIVFIPMGSRVEKKKETSMA